MEPEVVSPTVREEMAGQNPTDWSFDIRDFHPFVPHLYD